MIKVGKLVPEVYYRESRDFQLFGRSYDIIFNYLKTNIDLINNPLSKDLSLLTLNKLGFFPKRSYADDLLATLCRSYANIIKNKGSKYGVELAVKTILKGAGIVSSDNPTYYIPDVEPGEPLEIYLSDSLTSAEMVLLEELFDYILPIGSDVQVKPVSILELQQIIQVEVGVKYSIDQTTNQELGTLADGSTTITEEHIEGDFTNTNNYKVGDIGLAVLKKDAEDDD